ncbi:dioxygenase [Pseudonocardia sp. GCM10023141]|uniref:dioxygenase family protein n=1 Tax=Pseudonocardia sp. GCM10023141 TaxID=3252653 RepID=UPI003611B197
MSSTVIERRHRIIDRVVSSLNTIILEEKVTYAEYKAAVAWLISVGEKGEWPLATDVLLEHSVEQVNAETNKGSQSTIEGPYYIPDAPELTEPYTMPMRENEKGDALVFHGTVVDEHGAPLTDVQLDMWQADSDGEYSFINPALPDYLFRGKVRTDSEGRFTLHTMVPAPYQIPHTGPTGELLDAAGWHPWRPAHLHWIVTKEGYAPLTTQLYFRGGEWTDSDVAKAVKPELLLDLEKQDDGAGAYYVTRYQCSLGAL